MTEIITTPPNGSDGRSAAELESRRREIIEELRQKFRGDYDHPDIPFSTLQELTLLTQTLRRKNAGPPKEKRPAASRKPPSTLEDIF